MKFALLTALCWAVFAATVAVGAAPPPAELKTNARGDGESVKRALALLSETDEALVIKDPKAAAKLLDRVEALRPELAGSSLPAKNAIDHLRVVGLIGSMRYNEALITSRGLVARNPGNPTFYENAMRLSAPQELAPLLERARQHMSAENLPVLRDLLPTEHGLQMLQALTQSSDKLARPRLAEALIAIDWPVESELGARDTLRRVALDGRLDKADPVGARAFADQITTVQELAPLLVGARYAAIRSEAPAEERLRSALHAHDRASAALLAADPNDFARLVERSSFFRLAGRAGEAWALLEPHTTDMAKIQAGGERGPWIVEEAAWALLALGRPAEGVALMDRLLALDIIKHRSLINQAINRLGMLNAAGRYADAAAAAANLDRKAKALSTPYGSMWIWTQAACAHSMAGKPAAAAPWLKKIKAATKENPAAYTRALLCVDDLDAAAASIVARLQEEDDASDILMELQDYEPAAWVSPMGLMIDARLASVKGRPEVQAAVASKGRILRIPYR